MARKIDKKKAKKMADSERRIILKILNAMEASGFIVSSRYGNAAQTREEEMSDWNSEQGYGEKVQHEWKDDVATLRAELERVTKERENWRQQAEASERVAQRLMNAEAQVAALKAELDDRKSADALKAFLEGPEAESENSAKRARALLSELERVKGKLKP